MSRPGGATDTARRRSLGARAPAAALAPLAVLALTLALAGCGGSSGSGRAAQDATIAMNCPETVLYSFGRVVRRVYREGVASERTAVARLKIRQSLALRRAVEAGDARATQAAARALVATGKLTNLLVTKDGRVLANVGGPALAPLGGVIVGAGGNAIATYVTSVWSDAGFLGESTGIGQGRIALRERNRSVGGSFALPAGQLASRGKLTRGGTTYQYTSFAARSFPRGRLRVYLLKPLESTTAFCGVTSEGTLVNTLASVAQAIYTAEGGPRTLPQVRRVQHDAALLAAVAHRDPATTRTAIIALLNQHIVRLRVSAGSQLLSDVGGPFVLAPVSAPLRVHGRTIGSFVLSIQDDEGYLRLTKRLVGLRVLMYTGSRLVKNSLGPEPGAVPAQGSYTYRGSHFRVVTVNAHAFPSGPLTIRVLIPIPYS